MLSGTLVNPLFLISIAVILVFLLHVTPQLLQGLEQFEHNDIWLLRDTSSQNTSKSLPVPSFEKNENKYNNNKTLFFISLK